MPTYSIIPIIKSFEKLILNEIKKSICEIKNKHCL